MKRTRDDVKDFVQTLDIQSRLDPRESFYGGRTNAVKLYHKIDGQQRISYVDFTSLYPSTQKLCKYPVGPPQIITDNFKPLSEYFGIVKCKVLPPRSLYHPVLPYRSDNKLLFPLCRTCADKKSQNTCQCTEGERSITGTWCTVEVGKAVERGYVVLAVYEVYHWSQSTQYDQQNREGREACLQNT